MMSAFLRRLGLALAITVMAAATAGLSSRTARADIPAAPIEVRVVVVTTWEAYRGGVDAYGELHAWRTLWPLTTEFAFPAGPRPLLYDPERHVLAVLTGMATARAATSITALGLDPRFDLSHAYWIVAGTAGVDPNVGSVGSVAWAKWVVDGDLSQEIDLREAPKGWPFAIVPYDRSRPFERPAPPPLSDSANVAYPLNAALVDWAFARSRDHAIPDSPKLAMIRAPYSGPARQPPAVFEGDGLMSARTWYGPRLNTWAERWVDYYTGGKGRFAMSAEEDTGILQAITALERAGRARRDRVLVLRGASDYTFGPPGLGSAGFLAREVKSGFPAETEALDALYAAAAPVVRALADDWAHTRETTPGS